MKKKRANPAFDLAPRPFEPDHLSASSVTSFLTCGLQWRLSHVDGIHLKKMTVPQALGTALHSGMRPYWRGHEQLFFDKWRAFKKNKIDFTGSRLSWLDWYDRGNKMAEAVVRATDGFFDPARSRTEVNYDADLHFIKVVRRMDVFTEARNLPVLIAGNIERVSGPVLLDLKSSAAKYSDNSPDFSQQLLIYNIPGRRDDIPTPKISAYVVVTKSPQPKVQIIGQRYDKEEIKAEIKTIRAVDHQIREGVFIQNKGKHCQWCDFRYLCYARAGHSIQVPWEDRYVFPRDRSGHDAANGSANHSGKETSSAGADRKVKAAE